jgi:hypothetical protein
MEGGVGGEGRKPKIIISVREIKKKKKKNTKNIKTFLEKP